MALILFDGLSSRAHVFVSGMSLGNEWFGNMVLVGESSANNPLKRGCADIVTVFVSVVVAALLIQSMSGRPKDPIEILSMALAISLFHAGILYALRGYHSVWRFVSAHDVLRCLGAAGLSTVAAMMIWAASLPMAGWLIIGCATALSSISIRCMTRVAHNYGLFRTDSTLANPFGQVRAETRPKQALMIGYGENLETFLRAQRMRGADFEITGILSIGGQERATGLRGVPVLGSVGQIESVVRDLARQRRALDMLILTRDEMDGRPVAEILSRIDGVDAEIAWLPRADQLDTGGTTQLRPIRLEDLLLRPAKSFDAHACEALLSGARVLVTGAGGSIGSELVRQIATLSPGAMILADSSEHALYEIDREMGVDFPQVERVSTILDVRDRDAVSRLMQQRRPEFVFHAAALKHVPVVEGQPCEGLLTNVVGSRNVADAAVAAHVRAMVMVSTDKAVNPANVMGATKRLAEAYCQAMDADMRDRGGDTRFVTVRFGNVLGSNGSVVPLFRRQLAKGGPLTVTHPDVERFFMTIPEASRLILEAMLSGMEEDRTDQGIFVLDMGKPVKIIDLARQVIRLSGLRPDVDVKIVYTGLRPGEKLYEELMHETENLLATDHPSLMVAQPRFVQLKTVQNQIDNIADAARKGQADEVVRLLKVFIPEFDASSSEARKARERTPKLVAIRGQAS